MGERAWLSKHCKGLLWVSHRQHGALSITSGSQKFPASFAISKSFYHNILDFNISYRIVQRGPDSQHFKLCIKSMSFFEVKMSIFQCSENTITAILTQSLICCQFLKCYSILVSFPQPALDIRKLLIASRGREIYTNKSKLRKDFLQTVLLPFALPFPCQFKISDQTFQNL